jgi:hypothetical protein
MLLVGPSRLWITIPVVAAGTITYDKKWRQSGGSFLMKMFGHENIGKPEIEVNNQEKQITDFLKKHLEEDELPPINSVLVSLHPKAEIGDVERAPVPIVELNGLRRFIRKTDRKDETEIPTILLDKIKSALED